MELYKEEIGVVRLVIHVYECLLWRWWHRFDASRSHSGAILHELSFVVTKRRYMLKGEILKLTLHFPFVNSFHVYNVFIAYCVF